jgi:hypothetical protein
MFGPDVLAGVTAVAPEISCDDARVQARSEVEVRIDLAGRNILNRLLVLVGEEMLLVHMPFFHLDYRFNDERGEVVVDGLLGDVVLHRENEEGEGEAMSRGAASTPSVSAPSGSAPSVSAPSIPAASAGAGKSLFIPFECPACNASFQFAAEDQVRSCASCGRAWEVAEEGLIEVEHRLAMTSAASEPGVRRFPFWVVDARVRGFSPLGGAPVSESGEGEGIKVYVPAFESWQVEKLFHLGVRLTRAQPQYPTSALGNEAQTQTMPQLMGVTLRRREAERLAAIVLGSLASADPFTFSAFMKGAVDADGAELHWLPFRPSGLYLHEPLTGALLREWSGEHGPTADSPLKA